MRPIKSDAYKCRDHFRAKMRKLNSTNIFLKQQFNVSFCQLKIILILAFFLMSLFYTTLNMTKKVKMIVLYVLILLKVFFRDKILYNGRFRVWISFTLSAKRRLLEIINPNILLLCNCYFLHRILIYANLIFNFMSPHHWVDI